MDTKIYGAYTINEEIRKKSSSGGVFYWLAHYVIKKNGVVFGARFNKEWEVEHDYCETSDRILGFMGSKYVQSKIGSSYIKVKEFLERGRTVLFSGTPCQIAGLKKFLGKSYNNLILIDIICHGVPSPKVWKKYLIEITENDIKSIDNINFRNKKTGWYQYSTDIHFTNGNEISSTYNSNIYMKGFLQDIYLRPSCYNCAFKGIQRCSDITLADYWGVDKDCSKLYDNKGTSLLIVHTKKGEEMLEELKRKLVLKKVSERAINFNPSAVTSVKEPSKRDLFFERYDKEEVIPLIDKLTKIKLSKKVIFGIKRIVKKVLTSG